MRPGVVDFIAQLLFARVPYRITGAEKQNAAIRRRRSRVRRAAVSELLRASSNVKRPLLYGRRFLFPRDELLELERGH